MSERERVRVRWLVMEAGGAWVGAHKRRVGG